MRPPNFGSPIFFFAQRAIGPCPMQLVVVMAVRKAVSAATTIFTAISIRRFFFIPSFPPFRQFHFFISHFLIFSFPSFLISHFSFLIWQRPEALSPWPSA